MNGAVHEQNVAVIRCAWMVAVLLRDRELDYRDYADRWRGATRRRWSRDVKRLRAAGLRIESTVDRSNPPPPRDGDPHGIRYVCFDGQMAV